MTQTARHDLYTEEEYLALEHRSETRHEFVNGEIVDMAGGTPQHSLLSTNVTTALNILLRGNGRSCRVYSSDLRVGVESTSLYAYPDATVVCGPLQLHTKDKNTLVNPLLLVEVISPSSESYDRGAKFAHYQRIPSLMEYVLVSQDCRRVEHYRRLDNGQWLYTDRRDGTLELPSLGGAIALADVYDGIELPEAAAVA